MKILYSFFQPIRFLTLIFILILIDSTSTVYSQSSTAGIRRFQNTMVFGLGGGITLPQTDYETSKIGYALNGMGEYYFKTNSIQYIGLRLNINYDQVTGEDSRSTISTQDGPVEIPPKFSTGAFSVGFALTYGISINNVVLPYISGGVLGLWFDPTNGSGQQLAGSAANLYDKNTIAYNVEGGVKIFVSDKVSINISATQYFPQSDYLDDVAAAYSNDAFTTVLLGVSFAPFYKNDPDNDGITGSNDLCPDEPEDFDGFEDEDGCPDIDNDGDGILDVNDKCPNEAEDFDGFQDDDGCPDPDELLSEGKIILMADDIFSPNSAMINVEGKKYLDEVVTQLQMFPDEKWRIEGYMDSNGNQRFLRNLSLERAKAVLEYFSYFGKLNRENFQVFGMGDKSPVADNATEKGRKENRRIEIVPENATNSQSSNTQPEEEFNQFILRGDDVFEPNEATFTSLAKILLDEIADYIINQPESKWKIEGYMDNQGSASLLKKLSYNRAKAVYDYLIEQGLSPDQFTVSGLGSANPISTNDTEEGRSSNRRVLIIREK